MCWKRAVAAVAVQLSKLSVVCKGPCWSGNSGFESRQWHKVFWKSALENVLFLWDLPGKIDPWAWIQIQIQGTYLVLTSELGLVLTENLGCFLFTNSESSYRKIYSKFLTWVPEDLLRLNLGIRAKHFNDLFFTANKSRGSSFKFSSEKPVEHFIKLQFPFNCFEGKIEEPGLEKYYFRYFNGKLERFVICSNNYYFVTTKVYEKHLAANSICYDVPG